MFTSRNLHSDRPMERPTPLPEGESESPWLNRVAGRVYQRPVGTITAVRLDPEEGGIALSYGAGQNSGSAVLATKEEELE